LDSRYSILSPNLVLDMISGNRADIAVNLFRLNKLATDASIVGITVKSYERLARSTKVDIKSIMQAALINEGREEFN